MEVRNDLVDPSQFHGKLGTASVVRYVTPSDL